MSWLCKGHDGGVTLQAGMRLSHFEKTLKLNGFREDSGCEKAIEYIIYEKLRGDLVDKTFIQIDSK